MYQIHRIYVRINDEMYRNANFFRGWEGWLGFLREGFSVTWELVLELTL